MSGLAMQLKSGHMLRYKKRIFGKDWREEYVILFNDSTLVWFKEKGRVEPDGGVILKDAPELMAYGQFTYLIPNRPDLPEGYRMNQLLAFGTKGREVVQWFLCKTEDEMIAWMTAISNTLPPPPHISVLNEMCKPYENGHFRFEENYSKTTASVDSNKVQKDLTAAKTSTQGNGEVELSMGVFVGTSLAPGWGWGCAWGWSNIPVSGTISNQCDTSNGTLCMDGSTVVHGPVELQDDAYDADGFDGADFDACADFIAF